MDRYDYFPSSVYREEHPDWVPYTRQVVEKYYANVASEKAIDQTNAMENDPALKFLVDYLLLAGDTILREQGYDMDKYELYVSGLWGQDVKCAAGTDIHVHKHSQLCGWLFLETPENGAYPIFYDPRMNKPMMELDHVPGTEVKNATSVVNFNNVQPGTLLLANSWMQHQIAPGSAKEQTKTVHFVISHRAKACTC